MGYWRIWDEVLTVTQENDARVWSTIIYGASFTSAHAGLCIWKGISYVVIRSGWQGLLWRMGMSEVVPGWHTSLPYPVYAIYPNLLRDLVTDWSNEVWCINVKYILLSQGFMFLVVIRNWFSRYVFACMVSDTQNTPFCLDALNQAFPYNWPGIFNSDEGFQSTHGRVYPAPFCGIAYIGQYIHKSHNVTVLLYHLVFPAK